MADPELWRSDGTPDGTRFVYTSGQGVLDVDLTNLADGSGGDTHTSLTDGTDRR